LDFPQEGQLRMMGMANSSQHQQYSANGTIPTSIREVQTGTAKKLHH
jgi:hypothetical protein